MTGLKEMIVKSDDSCFDCKHFYASDLYIGEYKCNKLNKWFGYGEIEIIDIDDGKDACDHFEE